MHEWLVLLVVVYFWKRGVWKQHPWMCLRAARVPAGGWHGAYLAVGAGDAPEATAASSHITYIITDPAGLCWSVLLLNNFARISGYPWIHL